MSCLAAEITRSVGGLMVRIAVADRAFNAGTALWTSRQQEFRAVWCGDLYRTDGGAADLRQWRARRERPNKPYEQAAKAAKRVSGERRQAVAIRTRPFLNLPDSPATGRYSHRADWVR